VGSPDVAKPAVSPRVHGDHRLLEVVRITPTATRIRRVGCLSTVERAFRCPVSRGIASAEMVTGRRVAVGVFDAANPLDAMVVGVW